MFYKLVEGFSDVITGCSVIEHRKYGSASSLLATMRFKDGSSLHIKEYIFQDGKRKYSYHWQTGGDLKCRWDNSPHHRGISTFPHHKHMPGGVTDSKERTLEDVLAVIRNRIIGKHPS